MSSPAPSACPGLRTNVRSIGVSVAPGQTTFTRMFCGARSRASDRAKPMTPNFTAEYTGLCFDPMSPDVDAVKRIDPPPAFFITLIASAVLNITLLRFKLIASSISSDLASASPTGPGWP